jgi:hypothetical protein
MRLRSKWEQRAGKMSHRRKEKLWQGAEGWLVVETSEREKISWPLVFEK